MNSLFTEILYKFCICTLLNWVNQQKYDFSVNKSKKLQVLNKLKPIESVQLFIKISIIYNSYKILDVSSYDVYCRTAVYSSGTS